MSKDDYQDGVDALDRKDYATAARLLKPLAEQGNLRAQYFLGVMYCQGQGVPQDSTEAVRWFRRSAAQQCANAMCALGRMHAGGLVPQGGRSGRRRQPEQPGHQLH